MGAAEILLDYLGEAEVPYELIAHRRTETATAEAEALGADPREVAKTVVLRTDDEFVRVVLPASERLDLHKVRDVLDAKDVRLATEDALARAYPEFELGAVPPVSGAHRDRVLADRRLHETQWVVFEAGTHRQSVRVRTTDLLTVSDAELCDLRAD
jgi:Ala-tRNA(Pro) deacylase